MYQAVQFRVRDSYRGSEFFGIVLYSFMFLLVGVLAWAMARGMADEYLPDSPVMAQLVTLASIALVVWLWWLVIHPRLQWTFTVRNDYLQIGFPPFSEKIRLDDIRLIRLRPFDGSSTRADWVEITFGPHRRRLEIGADATGCAILLRERCRGALFIDQNGWEHAPAWTDDVRKTAFSAAIHYRLATLRLAAIAGGWGVAAVVAVSTQLNATAPNAFLLGIFAVASLLSALATAIRMGKAWNRWRFFAAQAAATAAN